MPDIYTTIDKRHTAQTEQADPRQIPNSAGGYTFQLDDEARLRRFLILGSDGGTYYPNAKELTKDSAEAVFRFIAANPRKVTDVVVEISTAGRAPKQNPALFTLAAVAGLAEKAEDRVYALNKLHLVARTGTHLFLFARYVEQFRGWGPALRRAVGEWYLSKSVDDLAYQAVKYRQREGWSHRDLLRLSHPSTVKPYVDAEGVTQNPDVGRRALFEWILRGTSDGKSPIVVQNFLLAQR